MENAVDALKIAFAVFVLVMALTVSIMSFNNVKSASDVILYTKDETNYYETETAYGKASENRIVGLETIVPTLYRYYQENFTIVFKQGTYNYDTGELSGVEYLPVYTTGSNKDLWEKSYIDEVKPEGTLIYKKYGITKLEDGNKVFSFDLDEETLRHEPWTGSKDKVKSNLDALLNGSVYTNPVTNKDYKDYRDDECLRNKKGFIGKYGESKFIETISEYKYSSDEKVSAIGSMTKEKTKRVITYTLIEKK